MATALAVTTLGLGVIPLTRWVNKLEQRFGEEIKDFLGLYNVNEYLAAAVTRRPAHYVKLVELRSNKLQTRYPLVDGTTPQLSQ